MTRNENETPGEVDGGYRMPSWLAEKVRASSDSVVALSPLPSPSKASLHWSAGLLALGAFVGREGHARVDQRWQEGGFKLGLWVATQRQLFRLQTLPAERISILEAHLGWVWNPFAQDFSVGLEHLAAYVEREGTARVPIEHIESGFRLGRWASKQRDGRVAGTLSSSRTATLEALTGWVWDYAEQSFSSGLRALDSFISREGSARVLKPFFEGDFDLGSWVSKKRTRYASGRMSTGQITELESREQWFWDSNLEDYRVRLEMLDVFVQREGHARIPQNHVELGIAMGSWVASRRIDYRAGKLSEIRIAELEARSGWTWSPKNDRFPAGVGALDAYILEFGHANVPKGYQANGIDLGSWVGTQRMQWKLGELSAERSSILAARTGWSWGVRGASEDSSYAHQVAALRLLGHCSPSRHGDETERALAGWCTKQRSRFSKEELEPDRVDLLESISGWTWDPRDDTYSRGLAALDAYILREGNLRIPRGHIEAACDLAAWSTCRRREYARGNLSSARIAELESRPAWSWNPAQDALTTALAALDVYIAREAHSMVPAAHLESGVKLGQWVGSRRHEYRKDTLSADRIAALESRPGWVWSTRPASSGAAPSGR